MSIALLALIGLAKHQSPVEFEVPFRLGEQAIIADARVNGRAVSMIFDTGFGGSALVDTAINVGPVSGRMTLQDFVGTFEASTVKLNSLTFGGHKVEVGDEPIIQQPWERMSANYGQHVDGILGFSVIKNNITGINFQDKKFIFYPKSFDITKLVPDNKRTFMAKLLPIGQSSMEMEVIPSTGKRMTLALDTGNAFYATTHKDVLERVGLWDETKTPKFTTFSGVASGAVASWSFKMPKISIFGIPVESSIWDVIDRPASSAEGDGTVGFGFLKNFNIIIDYEKRRVWFENFTGEVGNGVEGSIGVAGGLQVRTGKTLVQFLLPGGPAEAGGLKEGDQILSIDDTDLVNVDSRKLRSLLLGPVGSKVKLAISRGGLLHRYVIERRALVNE
jgi:predicted aspartyl protease